MGGPLAAGAGLTPQAASVLKERSSIMVPILGFLTCAIYALVWKYQTEEELLAATGDTSIKPGMDILLTFVTCGIWAIVTDYRNAKKCADVFRAAGIQRDNSTAVLLCMIFGLHFVAWYLLQEEFNALARLAQGRPVLATPPSAMA